MADMRQAREDLDTALRQFTDTLRDGALEDEDELTGEWALGDWVLVLSWVPLSDPDSAGYTQRVRGPMTGHAAAKGLLHVGLFDI